MSETRRVLVVDDQLGDIQWVIDLLEYHGFAVDVESNEVAARRRLERVKESTLSYALAIFDIMLGTQNMEELVVIDPEILDDSKDTGVRLCQYARKELQIPSSTLPIVCISARDDDPELRYALRKLNIPLLSRTPQSVGESLRQYIEEHLLPPEGRR